MQWGNLLDSAGRPTRAPAQTGRSRDRGGESAMVRRVVLSVLAAALVSASAPVAHQGVLKANAAAAGGACQITGTASLSPGVTTLPKATAYTFTGALKSCKGTDKT